MMRRLLAAAIWLGLLLALVAATACHAPARVTPHPTMCWKEPPHALDDDSGDMGAVLDPDDPCPKEAQS